MSNNWLTKQEAESLQKLKEDFWKQVMRGDGIKRKALPEDSVKLAWVTINGKREMLGVDNKTMEGFEMEEKIPTFKIPLVPKKYDEFERWCTSFDI